MGARRASSIAVMLVVAAVMGVAGPSTAQADEVTRAQARVDALQKVVAETTRKLVDGTRKWEADQASLKTVQLRLTNTRRHVAQAQAAAEVGQVKLDQMARNLYSRPVTGNLQLLLTQSPAAYMGTAEAVQVINKVAGSTDEVIRQATVARLKLQQSEAEQRQLTAEAAGLVTRSARRLADLKDLAQRTSDQLAAAQDALQAARDRKAAADRARAARERASRSRVTFEGGASCSGKSTQGQQNGNLDPASLCPLWMAPGQRLRSDAAAAFNKLSQYHAATVGGPLCVTGSYRSYQEQVSLYRSKPGLAAVPGTSNHGWGQAVDFCGGIEDSGSAAYQWMKANAGRFGWIHPSWAEPSGSRPEAWHWEYGTA